MTGAAVSILGSVASLTLGQTTAGEPIEVPPGVADRVKNLDTDVLSLSERLKDLMRLIGLEPPATSSRLDIFHNYIAVFVAAFLVTLIATPIMRRLAVAYGIIDKPNEARKIHRIPVAYLGGAAVFVGIMAGILYSYLGNSYDGLLGFHHTRYIGEATQKPYVVPVSVLLGLTVIMLVGLLDDVIGIRPHVKIGGQLIAAAALAADDVGVKLAQGVLAPIGRLVGNQALAFDIPIPALGSIHLDLVYWAGTAVIALFVLGACNASNLIDGLDGLLSGVTAIASASLLVVALTMAANDDGPRDAQRLVLCLSLLGACLGFLPYNFNPAIIFLGDCGSLLLGFCSIVIILSLGDTGQTQWVIAGLIIYAIPIIDTVLAIVRRRMTGRSISDPDDQHLHHMLKRALGVKGAVFALYGLGLAFGALGIAISLGRARVAYAMALVFAAFVAVVAIKIALRKQIEEQAVVTAARSSPTRGPRSARPAAPAKRPPARPTVPAPAAPRAEPEPPRA